MIRTGLRRHQSSPPNADKLEPQRRGAAEPQPKVQRGRWRRWGSMKTSKSSSASSPTPSLVSKLKEKVSGYLEGYDRVRIRGTLRTLYNADVMEAYVFASKWRFKEFAQKAKEFSDQMVEAAAGLAQRMVRPFQYFPSSKASKEDWARGVAAADGIDQGLIGLLSCVEPCKSYSIRRKADGSGCHFQLEERKCRHLYFYFEHPIFGFMHLRLQTWFPFQIDVCINGRHWLGRQLDAEGIGYQKQGNVFLWVENWPRAQALLDEQCRRDWRGPLEELLGQVHPTSAEICRPLKLHYTWTISVSEYASDLAFHRAEDLAQIYPSLVHHAVRSFSSEDVMRFLGHRVGKEGIAPSFEGEVISDLKHRPEGVRVKHRGDFNSIKFYDKQQRVLRVETTMHNPKDFREYRRAEGQPESPKQWRILRRSVDARQRRAEVSRASNHRYLEALSSASNTIPLFAWCKEVSEPVRRKGRRYRALNPTSGRDAELLRVVSRGEFNLNGFRNRDLRHQLYPGNASKQDQKKQTAAVSRQIRLLREHGLVAKVQKTHRYVITDKGRATMTALLSALEASTESLTKIAA